MEPATLMHISERVLVPLHMEASAATAWASGKTWRRYSAFAGVVALHILVFWIFATAMRPSTPITMTHELQVALFDRHMSPAQSPAPPLAWMFQMPEEALVPEPEIEILPEQGLSSGIAARAITQRLAPALDPSHVNERPELPGTFGGLIAALSLRLRVLVMPDGSVLTAEVAQSTGEAEIDKLAIDWVKDSWRYLPASVNGKPVEQWMTVVVRFAAIH